MNVYIRQNELQNAYIGEYKGPIVCDFTQSDYWFTIYSAHSWVTYGRDSNWFFGYNPTSSYKAISWSIPSNIYSKWNFKKVELEIKGTEAWCWWWISYNLDTDYSRVWWQGNMKDWNSPVSTTTLDNYPPANTVFTFTIDLENKVQFYSVEPTKTLALSDSDVSTILNYWSNGSLWIVAMIMNQSGTYTYIQKATFYF